MQYSQHDSRNQTYKTDSSNPENEIFNLSVFNSPQLAARKFIRILNFYSCQPRFKESSQNHQTDKSNAVSVDYHRDCDMRRIHQQEKRKIELLSFRIHDRLIIAVPGVLITFGRCNLTIAS